MKKIPLINGQYALVDENDYYKLIKYKWVSVTLYADKVYARNQKHGLLHKFILRENPNESFNVAFKNGNTLDCRRENLIKTDSRIQSPDFKIIKKQSQLGLFSNENSELNSKANDIISSNISGVREKIVYEAKYISPDGRVFNFGTFDSREEAQHNYDKMIKMIPK